MNQSPGLQPTARVPLRSSTTGALLCLGVVAVLLVVWFSRFDFHALMGDDLYGWAFFAGNPSYQDILLEAPGGNNNPVFSVVQLVLFDLFASDYRAWFAFNIALAFLIASVLFGVVRKLTRNDNAIALVAAIVFATSRFSYFNILQILGALEALSILFLLIIIWMSITFLRRRSAWPGYALAGMYLVVTLTHERYLALLPFMLLVVIFKRHLTKFARTGLFVAMLFQPILNMLVKQLVNAEFLMGTGGYALALEPYRFAEFLIKGLANMFWTNAGPQHLNGVSWGSVGNGARLLVGAIVLVVAFIVVASVVRVVRSRRRGMKMIEFRGLLLLITLLASLLIAASVNV